MDDLKRLENSIETKILLEYFPFFSLTCREWKQVRYNNLFCSYIFIFLLAKETTDKRLRKSEGKVSELAKSHPLEFSMNCYNSHRDGKHE